MFESLKNKIKRSHIFGSLYKKLSRKWRNSKKKKATKRIQKNGSKVIRFISSVGDKHGLPYFFDMGTLLGIIRENNFIGHDLDVDVGVFCNSEDSKKRTINLIAKSGAKIKYIFVIDGAEIVEASFIYKKIKFDLNFYKNVDDQSICYLMYRNPNHQYENNQFDVVELSCTLIRSTKSIMFCNCLVNIPENPDLYLSERYGSNWMIPDKNYVYWQGPSAKCLDDVKGKRTIWHD